MTFPGGKPYRAFGPWLREALGARAFRVSLHAGTFTCPNIDGRAGRGGCTYCDNRSFNPLAGAGATPSIASQMEAGILRGRRRGFRRFLAYFQTYSNTDAPPDVLRRLYDEALAPPDVVGLVVGTRPDCLGPGVLDLLAEYAARTHFWLELGLQSALDRTLRRVNRGHTVQDFVAAARAARARGLRVAAHVILGLPGESAEEMLSSADLLADLGVDGVKLHHLHVIRGTPMELELRRGAVVPLGFPEYRELAIRYLERLPPETVVFRLFGEAPDEMLVAPRWAESPPEARRLIEDEMRARGTAQGAARRGAASARP